MGNESESLSNFIEDIIGNDIRNNKNGGNVVTRFPPEPNGYLHIGHAKSICLNFGLAKKFNGRCHLRFDDTNPVKEDIEYIHSIQEDVTWLGFDWGEHLHYASDYFEKLYQYALELIKSGKAYVCSLNADDIRKYRGTLTEPGRDSPYRNRSVEENQELFVNMKNGTFSDGEHVLRAKIDMSSGNLNLRDPALYRIRKTSHHRTGDAWCIYPMYDFTHCLSDSIEEITHSICTLEFENNRPLYDWVLNELNTPCHPQQIEFARLSLTHTIMSKRKLLQLVQEGRVSGWDDPRMPTISGLRRRGYTPESIRDFCDRIGVARSDSVVEHAALESCIREDLNKRAMRAMAVLNPLKVIIENYPRDLTEELDAVNNPEDPEMGSRKILFSREIFIEEEDFMENPPKKFFRLFPGQEVRLKHAYYVTCTGFRKDEKTGKVTEVHCTYDPATKGGWSQDGRKVKGTLHWVSASHFTSGDVRLYDHLFSVPNPEGDSSGKVFTDFINPDSLMVIKDAVLEKGLAGAAPGDRYQFERQGYFCADIKDSVPGKPVFNRTVQLRDSWAKIMKSGKENE